MGTALIWEIIRLIISFFSIFISMGCLYYSIKLLRIVHRRAVLMENPWVLLVFTSVAFVSANIIFTLSSYHLLEEMPWRALGGFLGALGGSLLFITLSKIYDMWKKL